MRIALLMGGVLGLLHGAGGQQSLEPPQNEFPSPFFAESFIETKGEEIEPSVGSCDVTLESSVCLFGGKFAILPEAVAPGIVMQYSFDMVEPFDSSGNARHMRGRLLPGVGFGGVGASGFFYGSYLTIPSDPSDDQTFGGDFSISMWINLQRFAEVPAGAPKNPQFCPVLYKGSDANVCPGMLIDVTSGTMKVVISTEGGASEFFTSRSRLQRGSWTHLALVHFERKIRLYVNGILDSTAELKKAPATNHDQISVGGASWSPGSCHVPLLIDQLKVYEVAIGRDNIQAEASAALGGIEPSFLTLSCVGCTTTEAVEGCPEGYHLCEDVEVSTGVGRVAQRMGWTIDGLPVLRGDVVQPNAVGVGVCCGNL